MAIGQNGSDPFVECRNFLDLSASLVLNTLSTREIHFYINALRAVFF
jgi:hypothetical protein